jgi:aerobic carbon-monoxide dehydrogenase small subunit
VKPPAFDYVAARTVDEAVAQLQQAFWDHHGLQCGFCTPGMPMTAEEIIQRFPLESYDEIRELLSGNPCRCTSYQNIVTSVREAAKTMRTSKPAA